VGCGIAGSCVGGFREIPAGGNIARRQLLNAEFSFNEDGMDPESRVVFAAQEMEKVHPGLLDNLEGSFTKVWPADPWAGGAGSHPAPGQLTTLCAGLEQPEGRVHFAGEHLSAWPYWMQGALQSGLRAAKEAQEANVEGG
jgi:monoamine oxidase